MFVLRISRMSAKLASIAGAVVIAVALPLLGATGAAADDGSSQTPPPPPPATTNGHGWIG